MIKFILDRRISFTFSLASIVYGFYHFFNQNILLHSDVYKPLNTMFGAIGGGLFGLIFIVFGSLKIIGLFADIVALKLPMYFALLAMWSILGICFLISSLQGYQNAGWIYAFTIVVLSTSILTNNTVIIKEGENY